MKERPILFSAPMVRAILEGRKTQTRRIVKMTDRATTALVGAPRPAMEGDRARWCTPALDSGADYDAWNAWCPYGKPGDRLWVREGIELLRATDERADSAYVADGTPTKADAWPWKSSRLPPMHCPRGLSRITLRVTSVRVERLHAISEEGARAEGVARDEDGWWLGSPSREYPHGIAYGNARAAFERLWDGINGKCALWASNPWVWVVGFERVEAADV